MTRRATRGGSCDASRDLQLRWRSVALEIEINREKCMGSGNCSFWAPGVFDLDEDGIAIVIDPTAAPDERIVLAMQGCPTQAIIVTEK